MESGPVGGERGGQSGTEASKPPPPGAICPLHGKPRIGGGPCAACLAEAAAEEEASERARGVLRAALVALGVLAVFAVIFGIARSRSEERAVDAVLERAKFGTHVFVFGAHEDPGWPAARAYLRSQKASVQLHERGTSLWGQVLRRNPNATTPLYVVGTDSSGMTGRMLGPYRAGVLEETYEGALRARAESLATKSQDPVHPFLTIDAAFIIALFAGVAFLIAREASMAIRAGVIGGGLLAIALPIAIPTVALAIVSKLVLAGAAIAAVLALKVWGYDWLE